jgi:hypothetical protein
MKRIFTTLIAWSLFFVVWSLPVLAAFPDVPATHPHIEGIEYGQANGILDGYGDGLFRPNQSINRAEFTKIVMNALFKAEISGGNCFPDVTDDWFAPFVCTAKLKTILGGYPDGTFKPGQTISFAEAAKIIVNAFNIEVSTDTEVWFKPFIEALGVRRAIPLTVNQFGHDMTRGELAEIIYRLLEEVTDKPSQYYESIETGVYVPLGPYESDWNLSAEGRVEFSWLTIYDPPKLDIDPVNQFYEVGKKFRTTFTNTLGQDVSYVNAAFFQNISVHELILAGASKIEIEDRLVGFTIPNGVVIELKFVPIQESSSLSVCDNTLDCGYITIVR